MHKVVESKKLGKKSGSGFYFYDGSGKKLRIDQNIYSVAGVTGDLKMSDQDIVHCVLFPMINEAALCLQENIVTGPQDVDLGMIMGTGFPPFRGGPLKWADSIGVSKIVDELEELAAKHGGAARFKPSEPLLQMARTGQKFYR
jgi:3-hydroxyacyl-CoA dehydrogenase/enoyl-CoA hydratase/3-hydroxybutyryl-CoA epimerase